LIVQGSKSDGIISKGILNELVLLIGGVSGLVPNHNVIVGVGIDKLLGGGWLYSQRVFSSFWLVSLKRLDSHLLLLHDKVLGLLDFSALRTLDYLVLVANGLFQLLLLLDLLTCSLFREKVLLKWLFALKICQNWALIVKSYVICFC